MMEMLETCWIHLDVVKLLINNWQPLINRKNISIIVRPIEEPIAVVFSYHNTTSGHVEQRAKHITLQYIPLKKLLKCVLESLDFMSTVLQYRSIHLDLRLVSIRLELSIAQYLTYLPNSVHLYAIAFLLQCLMLETLKVMVIILL